MPKLPKSYNICKNYDISNSNNEFLIWTTWTFFTTFNSQSFNMIKKYIIYTKTIVIIFIVNTNFEIWKIKINDKVYTPKPYS
jgi:hypothetical protein